MVRVTYHCPYCGAVTGVDREGYLADESVTREPLAGWEYASTTGDVAAADGIEFVCLGDVDPTRSDSGSTHDDADQSSDNDDTASASNDTGANDPPGGAENPPGSANDPSGGPNDPAPDGDGCGRTFYVNFVRYEDGERVDHRQPEYDGPRFDFRP